MTERNISVWLPLEHPLLGTWPTTQAYMPNLELNWGLFGSQAGTQSPLSHTTQVGFLTLFFGGGVLTLKREFQVQPPLTTDPSLDLENQTPMEPQFPHIKCICVRGHSCCLLS